MNKIFEQLLQIRGVSKSFLKPQYEDLSDPMKLPDMEKAVKRLMLAKEKQQKVLIYGDYDVDGVTATAIMQETLRLIGIEKVEMMLPDRFIDGYGMSERLIEKAKQDKIKLVITVDCGSNNAEIIAKLKKEGIDTVATDHHELSSEIPERAVAVVNPKRRDFIAEKTPGLKELSGAGVAFMLARALAKKGAIAKGQEKWLLDLAMIGTICDAMVLKNDNRIICKYGMLVLAKTRRVGLKELMRVAGVTKINAEAIGFQIGPRLNAAGRMETAELALKLLLTESKVEAAKMAGELDTLNQERRKQQQQAVKEVEDAGISDEPVIVVKGKWHEGIVGIIAGRLTERYKKPSFVLAEVEEKNGTKAGVLKGSGRSFGEFNLAVALSECQKVIISGGGHAAACGLKLEAEKYEDFKVAINQYYRGLNLQNQERFLEEEEDIATDEISEINLDLMDELVELEPFGEGNPEPVFLLERMFVLDVTKMGAEEQHLKMLVRDKKGKTMKLVAFYAPKTWLNLQAGIEVNLWISLMMNEWNGTRSVEGQIKRLEIS